MDKPCKHFLEGNCCLGDKCIFRHTYSECKSIEMMISFKGHQKAVAGIVQPTGSDKLYSAGLDGILSTWIPLPQPKSYEISKCVDVSNNAVGSMIFAGSWLIIGTDEFIRIRDINSTDEMDLGQSHGQVYAIAYSNQHGLLFAGTHDGTVVVWEFKISEGSYKTKVSLVGHQTAVTSIAVNDKDLFSASMDKTIRVWDLATFQCIQSISQTDAVMYVLWWEKHLLSCSLDQTVKVYGANMNGDLELKYTHIVNQGILAISVMYDAKSKPVLLCSLKGNNVYLYDLPSFSHRGTIFSKAEVGVMTSGSNGLFFIGDFSGDIQVWKWVDGSQT